MLQFLRVAEAFFPSLLRRVLHCHAPQIHKAYKHGMTNNDIYLILHGGERMAKLDSQLKTAALLGLLSALFLLAGYLLGGSTGMSIALGMAVLFNFATYYWSDSFVLWMYRAKPAAEKDYPQFHRLVRELAGCAHLPMPRLYIIESQTPNAFATGRSPQHAAVAVTTGILSLLSEKQLRGVLAHELSHVKNHDMLIATMAATIAAAISYLASMARWGMIFGGGNNRDGPNILEYLVLAIVTPLIAMVIQLAISRQREFLADASGAKLSHDPEGLASALEALGEANKKRPLRHGSTATASLFIVNPFSGQAFISLFSTHPPLQERVKRLRAMR